MTGNTPTAADDAANARAAEQARLRKERREAKIRAGGTSRLNKIAGLTGGHQRVPDGAEDTAVPQPTTAPAREGHADPDEVDISQHFYTPNTTRQRPVRPDATPPVEPGAMSEAQLRQMMLGFEHPPGGTPPNPFMASGAQGDPMMAMLQQMMGSAGMPGQAAGLAGSSGPANPFAVPLQGMTPAAPPDRYVSLWRLAHFVVAVGLGLYIAMCTPFTGTKTEREQAAFDHKLGVMTEQDQFKHYFFYAFGTAETVLLTSRLLFDRGRTPPGGLLSSVVSMLPLPIKGYVETGLRYAQIFSTIRSDILTCVFVLGVCSWFRAI